MELFEYQKQRVLLTSQLSDLFKCDIDQIRKAFQKNRDQYVENVHYFSLKDLDFQKFISENNKPIFPKDSNKAFLWTELGVSVFSKTLNTSDALEKYKDLKYSYFKSSVNEFDIMRKMLDILENTRDDINEARQKSNEAINRVAKLEKIIKDVNTKDYLKASNIAVHLNLFSKAGLPHVSLVAAIAKTLSLKINKNDSYQDDNIVIKSEAIEDICYWQVYYKPKGSQKIIDWFEKNKNDIEFTEFYKRDTKEHKKGEVKKHGYIVNKIKYNVQ